MKPKILLGALPLLLLQACGGSSEFPIQPQSQPKVVAPNSGPKPWTVRYMANCSEDSALTQCAGAYGFEVASTGRYRVGPGPDGQETDGYLTAAEIEQIRPLIIELGDKDGGKNAKPPVEDLSRDGSASKPGKKGRRMEQLEIRYDDSLRASQDRKLLGSVRELVSRYYPERFPNPCSDEDADLRKFYDLARRCDNDSDCSFVDDEFQPMDREYKSQTGQIMVDDCTNLSPMVAANSFKAVEFQRDLLVRRARAREACGEELKKRSCLQGRSFKPGASRPRCIKGRCQVGIAQYNLEETILK